MHILYTHKLTVHEFECTSCVDFIFVFIMYAVFFPINVMVRNGDWQYQSHSVMYLGACGRCDRFIFIMYITTFQVTVDTTKSLHFVDVLDHIVTWMVYWDIGRRINLVHHAQIILTLI